MYERSAALESRVRESLRRLERLNDRIDRCWLTVEGPVPEGGNSSYLVRIELNLPGARINAGKAELIIGKQRNGPIGTVELVFFEETATFQTLARQTENDEEEEPEEGGPF